MKILSVFSNGNEITLRNTMWGQEKIFYNRREVSTKYSLLGAVHVFDVYEGTDLVEYVVKVGYNNLGVSANIWRDGEPILSGLCTTYESCRPERPPTRSDPRSYHRDLV